jgi:hypothetical protein
MVRGSDASRAIFQSHHSRARILLITSHFISFTMSYLAVYKIRNLAGITKNRDFGELHGLGTVVHLYYYLFYSQYT